MTPVTCQVCPLYSHRRLLRLFSTSRAFLHPITAEALSRAWKSWANVPPSLRASRVGLTFPLHPSPALSPQSYPLNVTRHLEAAPRSLPHLTRRQSHHCAQIPSDVLKILTDLYPVSTASYPTHSYMALFIISQHIICSLASIIPESLNGHVLLPLPELNPPRRRNLPPAPSYCALSLSVFLHSSYCR